LTLKPVAFWRESVAAVQGAGRPVAAVDALITAAARYHSLHVMTMITTDFEPTVVLLLNPWVNKEAWQI
jgi:hypothetical protein